MCACLFQTIPLFWRAFTPEPLMSFLIIYCMILQIVVFLGFFIDESFCSFLFVDMFAAKILLYLLLLAIFLECLTLDCILILFGICSHELFFLFK